MSQGAGQRVAEKAGSYADELSLDDLDLVVGGRSNELHNNQLADEGYHPPTVTAPDHLPAQISQVEQQVSSHTITGDQAVSEIAGIIGSQPDHSMQNIAGAEIASLIGRGIIEANSAITDLHHAVTQDHSLSGDQAAGVLAGMVIAQSQTAGEAASISTAAKTEITNLISAGALTPDHAVTAVAAQTGQDGGMVLMSEINSLVHQYALTPSSVAADIAATVDSNDLTGTQAITVLAGLATSFPAANHPFLETAGHEIASLVTQHNIAPTDAVTALVDAMYIGVGGLSDADVPGLMLAVVDADPVLAAAAGAELASLINTDPFVTSGGFQSAVTTTGATADHTMALLLSTAHNGAASWATEMAVELYTNNTFSMTQVMTAIQDNASTAANADDAVTMLHGLVNSGYASAFAAPAEAALVSMIHNHQITATQAATDLTHIVTSSTDSRGFEMLMAVATAGTSDATSAVTAAVDSLAQSMGAAAVVQALAGVVGAASLSADNAAIDTAALQQISGVVSSGALTADAAIEALTNIATTTYRWTGKEALCGEIATIDANANPPLSATQVMADVMAAAPAGDVSDTVLVLAFLAGHGADFQAAAGAALAAIINPNDPSLANPLWIASDVTFWVGSTSTLSAASAIALLTAAVGNGSTAIPPNVAGTAIANLVTSSGAVPADVTASIHASVVGGMLGGDAALVLLANLAANASTAQIAVNSEMLALVSGASPIVQPGHAVDVITSLRDAAQAAQNTAFVTILNSELAVLASRDPATAVFSALSTTTSAANIETAAAQLASAMASGASSAATVMADVDQALANATLTVPQAAELLVDIACHGNLAAQTAAGAEFAKITNTAGTGIFDGSQIMISQAILACIGIGLGASSNGSMQTVSTTMTTEAALAFVMGALGSAATTDATRSSFETAMTTLLGGNWYGVPLIFPAPGYAPQGMASSFATAIGDIATAHAMSGPELIRAVFVLGDSNYFSASRELQTLIGHQSVSMTDVNTAIISGWWQIDNAVQVLAGLSSTPAVMTELMGLVTGGTITASRFIADIHEALTPPPYVGAPSWPLTAADYVRVMEALAPSTDTTVQTALVTELAAVINNGSVDMTSVQAILAAAGSNESGLIDQILVALDGNDFGQLVGANLVTLDHALSVLATNNEVYDAVTHAVTAGTYDVTLLTNGLTHAVSDGTLSASNANTMALQMAETATGALATMAGAVLAAVVSSGGMTADAVMAELTSNANKYANILNGSVGINIPQMTDVLNGFIAHCDPASSAAAAQEAVTLSQVAFSFFPSPGSALPFVIAAAGNANAASLSSLAGMLEGMIARGDTNIDTVATAVDGLAGGNALALYTGIAKYATMSGVTQIMSDALGKIMDLLPNQVSASAAVLALNDLVGSASTFSSGANYAALVQAAGAEINAISAAYPDASALSGIDDAIRAGTLTAVQAAGMLVSMINGSTVSTAIAAEINTLIQEHLVTAGQIADAVITNGTAQSQSADAVVAALANLVTIGPAVANAAGSHIELMIQTGQISATQAVSDLNGLINHPLTVAQSIGLFTSICIVTGSASIMDVVNGAIADNLVQLLNSSVIAVRQLTDGIANAVGSGGASADQAVALYATIARGHSDHDDLATQGITALINGDAISPNAAFGDIHMAFADAADFGIPFMLVVATNASATAAFAAAFANCLAGFVVPDGAPVTPGTMSASAAFAFVHDAYRQGLTTPHAPGTITAQQELVLLANMLAVGSSGGPASSLLPLVHTELVSLITSQALTDTAVVAALEAVGTNNATIQAMVNTEIGHLETDVGPQMLIDVAAQTGADIAGVGSQLATLIANGSIDIGHVMTDIVAANSAGDLSNSQALTMIVSLLGNATGSGAYEVMQLGATALSDWKTSTAWALEQLAQHGLSADSIGAAIQGVAGYGPALMDPSYAVSLLACTAAYSDLQGAAAGHIASMLATSSFNLTGTGITSTVVGNVSTLAGHLQAADAVRLLALVAATNGTAAIYGQIADEFGDPQLPVHIAADTVAGTIESMVQSGALTGQQALHFLAPYGDVAPAAAGHAIGDLIASNQVTMANFVALIYGGVSQDAQQIQNTSYWQQVAGTGSITFTDAILVLTAMTSRTSAAVTELTSILSADSSSVWSIVENALVNAGQNPTTFGLTPQEVVRGLTLLVTDPAAAASHGGSFSAQLASDISSLVGPTMTLADALTQILSVGANGPQALSDGAGAIVGTLIGTGPANGLDGILSAVGHGITADQAVTVLTELCISQSINLQSHIRADIGYLIANGQLLGTQALSDVHNACVANGISASQELSLLAGIYASSSGNAAVETAVASQIDTLINGGRFTLAQVMDGLAQGTLAPSSAYPTQAQNEASYLAGGLSSDGAAALMAQVAAGSSDPAAAGAAASEIAALIAANRMDQALAMNGIGAAVAAGVLDAAKAVVMLASMPLNVSDAIHTAAGGEIGALISNHGVTLDQAVATLVAMAHQGQAIQQLQAGAAFGLLVAQNVLDIATAVGDVQGAVQSHALTADQAVTLLAGMNVDTAAGVSTATGNAIASLIAQGEPVASVVSLLLTAAESGSTAVQAGAGTILGMLVTSDVVSTMQAIQSIDTAFTSGTLPASAALNLLLNIAGAGDAAAQAVAGQEIGHIVQSANSTAGLATLLASVNLSQDQAVVVLAAAVAGASTSALQTQIAALIQGLVTSGPISVTQVMSDIDAAVGHGLTATEALITLAHLEEAGVGAMRTSVLTETVALVTNHDVAAVDAATTLIAAAHGGSTALQSLVGGMLAALADHGLLTDQQVADAVSGASTISISEALGVLVGMGANGDAAAQGASGAGILTLVWNGRLDVQTVVSLIDNEARQNTISPERALQIVLNIMGAAIGSLNAGATGTVVAYDKYVRDQMAAEVVALTTSVSFNGNDGQATLINAAGGSVALAEAVGWSLSAMWAADQRTPNPVVRNGTPLVPILDAAVASHQMTADEALMLALASSAGGQQQTLLTGLVQIGTVTVDQAVHFLAVTAAQTGDSDTANPNLAYSGVGGSDPTLMTAAIRDLQALITGIAGVPALTNSATVANDIVAAAVSHDISGMQAASLLANLAGRLGTNDALVAAGAIGALVTQHQIDNLSAMQSIAWAVGATSGLSQDQASLMYASMALSTDPAVQQIAFWAYNNLGTETLAQAFHGITASSSFTHDQAFVIITTIASGLVASGLRDASSVSSALAGEVVAMVTSHQLTGDHAIAMLASLAARSDFQLNSLGVELDALIAANAVSLGQVVNDLTHSALSVDQVMTALTGISAADPTLDPQVLGQITAVIAAGTITVAHAMTDIGNAAPDVALRLLTACANAPTNIEDAAAAEMATLLAQGSAQSVNSFYAYAKANLDAVHAIGWIASVAAHGNDALQSYVDSQFQHEGLDIAALLTNYLANFTPSTLVQYYIGQELGRLIDHSTLPWLNVANVITALEQAITGTQARNDLATTAGTTSGNMAKAMTADTAATVLLGLINATHNADAEAAVNADLKLVSGQVDAEFVGAIAELMPAQQALTQFVTMVQNGWVNPALVAKQLSDMVAAGKLTVDQVITAMAPLDTGHQLTLVTEMVATNEVSSNNLTSQFAALVLLTWGVAQTSPVYASLHDALMQVVPDFVGLARGTTTASQAINDVKAAAAAHGVSADLVLLAVYQSTMQDAGAADFAGSATGALSQIGQELYSHLADGTAAQTVAQMVLSGGMHESDAAVLMQELAGSATIPPNQIMQAVAGGEMSVWYADAHYPAWSSNSAEVAFTEANAVGMMRVEVHSAEDVQAILHGTMTGAQAVADILAAGGSSEYAKDLGLMALVHGLDGTSAATTALPAIDAEIGNRIMGDTTANALVGMNAHGWLPADQAVDLLRSEITAATSGLSANSATLVECMALAQLDLAASGQVDPNASSVEVELHGGPSSHAIENILETADAAKILTGLGSLQLTETDSYELGAGLALAQNVTSVLIAQLQAQDAANPGSTGSSSSSDWASSLPPAMQSLMHYADIASQYFTLGMSYANTGIDALKQGFQSGLSALETNFAPAGDIAALTANPASVQHWADLGVDLSVGGVPGASAFGLPGWASGLQAAVINEAVADGASLGFLGANIGSHAAVMILSIPAIENGMHDYGITLGAMKVIADTCSLVSGMISGTVHASANMQLMMGTDLVNAFTAVCTGHDATSAADQLGKDMFAYMTGLNYDSVAQVGNDVGAAMVDLFSGSPQNLSTDASALGSDALTMIASNPFVQVVGSQLSSYFGKMEDLLATPAQDLLFGAFFLGA